MIDVSVIVVSYNTRDLTLDALRSVYQQTEGIEFEVIVVDNASADGSADAIAEALPQVRLIRLTENVGFAVGNNLAAKSGAGEHLLLLNPDTIVRGGAIQALHAFAKARPDAGLYGGRTVFADGSLNPTSVWGAPTLWSMFCRGVGLSALFRGSALFDPESYGRWRRDSMREVDIITGCFLLIRREIWEELGGFDEQFFMYGEEVDLCLRAQAAGYRCLMTPDAEIVHYGGASETVRGDKIVRLFRSKALLFRRHWRPAAAAFGVLMLELWAMSRSLGLRLAVGAGRTHLRPAAEAWTTAWKRRREWARGAE